jgi:hypothetical protein
MFTTCTEAALVVLKVSQKLHYITTFVNVHIELMLFRSENHGIYFVSQFYIYVDHF